MVEGSHRRSAFFRAVRAIHGALTAEQVAGFEVLLDGFLADGLLDHLPVPAYLLATCWHETGKTMQPIAEWGRREYFDRYDPVLADSEEQRSRARRMGNTRQGDGFKYRGRGYVQLTWKANYAKAGRLLGVDLVANPDLALEPAIAYRILVTGMREGWFTGKRLADYLRPGRAPDYIGARRVINGQDRAALIAQYARQFERALTQARVAP